jgi:TonB-linked SusC/RagA family outer membrane protein
MPSGYLTHILSFPIKKPLMKRITILFTVILFTAITYAQNAKTVTGTVTSADTNKPLEGVAVTEKGTRNGGLTDASGNYSITLRTNNATLVFSFVGYATQEKSVGDNSTINISLSQELSNLNTVVVTALGIKREVRTLGYASQQVTATEIAESKQSNLINALQGKVAGVTINGSGGGPGQGASILIRGVNSLNPSRSNQPLFVIDGLPVDNSTFTTGTTGDRGASLPNRMSDINPNDIETINVLKGGAATALYGLRGANGVIVITTKSGQAGKLNVNFNSSYSIDDIDKLPDLQLTYSQGFGGEYDSTSFWPAWGPTVEDAKKIDPTHPAQLFNNWKRAYNTGHQYKSGITFSGGSDKATFSSSLSYLRQEGLIPSTYYQDISVRVNGQLKFSDKFKMGTSLYYINTNGNFYDANRYNEQLVYWAPRWDVRDYLTPQGTMKTYGNDNPVYVASTNKFKSQVNHVIGSVNFAYTPVSWFTATYLFGADEYGDARTATAPGLVGFEGEFLTADNQDYDGKYGTGFVHEYQLNYRQLNSNLLLTFDHTWANKFQTTLRLGNDVLDRNLKRTSAEGSGLDLYNLYTLDNAHHVTNSTYMENYRIIGLYGDLTLGYNNYLYLTLTGRNDWTSSLEKNHRSFFYPSASLSYIFSQHFTMPSWFSYGKFRTSLAGIGKDADPYSTSITYVPAGPPISNNGTDVIPWSLNGASGIPDLLPEKTTTFEIGADLSFLNNRLGLNFTWYKSNSKDQIIPVSTSYTTGFSSITLNAGEIENKGVEISVNATPVKSKDFNWNVSANFSANRNKIISIYAGSQSLFINSVFGYGRSTVSSFYIPGESAGAIFGTPIVRYGDNDLSLHVNKSLPMLIDEDGFPVYPDATNQKILGNAYPKWIGGLSNTLTYKNWSLYFMWDMQAGVQKYDQFADFLAAFGESALTANRNETIVFDGVTADGKQNTKPVWLGQGVGPDGVDYGSGYYRNIYRGISENFVEDASWVRLRTATLSYSLPKKIFTHSILSNATVSFTGTNLLLFTKYTGFDPETRSDAAAGSNFVISSGFSYPALRSYIFSLNLTF